MKKMSTKKLVTISMLTALSYILIFIKFPLIPQVSFITYTPSSIPIVIGGVMFGPFAALVMSSAVTLIEFITISSTGIDGLIMNIVSMIAFTVTIALIYKYKRTTLSLILSLILGTIVVTAIMVPVNLIITPMFMGVPIDVVKGLILPAIIPVNLLKYAINAILAYGIYKSIHKVIEVQGYDKD